MASAADHQPPVRYKPLLAGRNAAAELEWLLGLAHQLTGSPEVTARFGRGGAGANARIQVTGTEAVGIGADAAGALCDACDGLADGLARARQTGGAE
ncbi:MAG: hypothetical protein ACYCXW_19430 [Solirubrobacteraceae bacterium]